MGFTKEKFQKITTNSRLKKIGFWLKEYLKTQKNEALEKANLYIDWLRETDTIILNKPQSYYESGILYHKILSIINESPYEDIYPFDNDIGEIKKFDIVLILDNIRSPYNVGSIIRTSECFGVKKIISTGITPKIDNQRVKRVSMNSQIETLYFEKNEDAIELVLKEGYKIVCIEKTKNSVPYNNFFIKNPCFILGNEEFGIDPKILKKSEYIIHIPLYGRKNSLNVSVTAGVILSNYINLYLKNTNTF